MSYARRDGAADTSSQISGMTSRSAPGSARGKPGARAAGHGDNGADAGENGVGAAAAIWKRMERFGSSLCMSARRVPIATFEPPWTTEKLLALHDLVEKDAFPESIRVYFSTTAANVDEPAAGGAPCPDSPGAAAGDALTPTNSGGATPTAGDIAATPRKHSPLMLHRHGVGSRPSAAAEADDHDDHDQQQQYRIGSDGQVLSTVQTSELSVRGVMTDDAILTSAAAFGAQTASQERLRREQDATMAAQSSSAGLTASSADAVSSALAEQQDAPAIVVDHGSTLVVNSAAAADDDDAHAHSPLLLAAHSDARLAAASPPSAAAAAAAGGGSADGAGTNQSQSSSGTAERLSLPPGGTTQQMMLRQPSSNASNSGAGAPPPATASSTPSMQREVTRRPNSVIPGSAPPAAATVPSLDASSKNKQPKGGKSVTVSAAAPTSSKGPGGAGSAASRMRSSSNALSNSGGNVFAGGDGAVPHHSPRQPPPSAGHGMHPPQHEEWGFMLRPIEDNSGFVPGDIRRLDAYLAVHGDERKTVIRVMRKHSWTFIFSRTIDIVTVLLTIALSFLCLAVAVGFYTDAATHPDDDPMRERLLKYCASMIVFTVVCNTAVASVFAGIVKASILPTFHPLFIFAMALPFSYMLPLVLFFSGGGFVVQRLVKNRTVSIVVKKQLSWLSRHILDLMLMILGSLPQSIFIFAYVRAYDDVDANSVQLAAMILQAATVLLRLLSPLTFFVWTSGFSWCKLASAAAVLAAVTFDFSMMVYEAGTLLALPLHGAERAVWSIAGSDLQLSHAGMCWIVCTCIQSFFTFIFVVILTLLLRRVMGRWTVAALIFSPVFTVALTPLVALLKLSPLFMYILVQQHANDDDDDDNNNNNKRKKSGDTGSDTPKRRESDLTDYGSGLSAATANDDDNGRDAADNLDNDEDAGGCCGFQEASAAESNDNVIVSMTKMAMSYARAFSFFVGMLQVANVTLTYWHFFAFAVGARDGQGNLQWVSGLTSFAAAGAALLFAGSVWCYRRWCRGVECRCDCCGDDAKKDADDGKSLLAEQQSLSSYGGMGHAAPTMAVFDHRLQSHGGDARQSAYGGAGGGGGSAGADVAVAIAAGGHQHHHHHHRQTMTRSGLERIINMQQENILRNNNAQLPFPFKYHADKQRARPLLFSNRILVAGIKNSGLEPRRYGFSKSFAVTDCVTDDTKSLLRLYKRESTSSPQFQRDVAVAAAANGGDVHARRSHNAEDEAPLTCTEVSRYVLNASLLQYSVTLRIVNNQEDGVNKGLLVVGLLGHECAVEDRMESLHAIKNVAAVALVLQHQRRPAVYVNGVACVTTTCAGFQRRVHDVEGVRVVIVNGALELYLMTVTKPPKAGNNNSSNQGQPLAAHFGPKREEFRVEFVMRDFDEDDAQQHHEEMVMSQQKQQQQQQQRQQQEQQQSAKSGLQEVNDAASGGISTQPPSSNAHAPFVISGLWRLAVSIHEEGQNVILNRDDICVTHGQVSDAEVQKRHRKLQQQRQQRQQRQQQPSNSSSPANTAAALLAASDPAAAPTQQCATESYERDDGRTETKAYVQHTLEAHCALLRAPGRVLLRRNDAQSSTLQTLQSELGAIGTFIYALSLVGFVLLVVVIAIGRAAVPTPVTVLFQANTNFSRPLTPAQKMQQSAEVGGSVSFTTLAQRPFWNCTSPHRNTSAANTWQALTNGTLDANARAWLLYNAELREAEARGDGSNVTVARCFAGIMQMFLPGAAQLCSDLVQHAWDTAVCLAADQRTTPCIVSAFIEAQCTSNAPNARICSGDPTTLDGPTMCVANATFSNAALRLYASFQADLPQFTQQGSQLVIVGPGDPSILLTGSPCRVVTDEPGLILSPYTLLVLTPLLEVATTTLIQLGILRLVYGVARTCIWLFVKPLCCVFCCKPCRSYKKDDDDDDGRNSAVQGAGAGGNNNKNKKINDGATSCACECCALSRDETLPLLREKIYDRGLFSKVLELDKLRGQSASGGDEGIGGALFTMSHFTKSVRVVQEARDAFRLPVASSEKPVPDAVYEVTGVQYIAVPTKSGGVERVVLCYEVNKYSGSADFYGELLRNANYERALLMSPAILPQLLNVPTWLTYVRAAFALCNLAMVLFETAHVGERKRELEEHFYGFQTFSFLAVALVNNSVFTSLLFVMLPISVKSGYALFLLAPLTGPLTCGVALPRQQQQQDEKKRKEKEGDSSCCCGCWTCCCGGGSGADADAECEDRDCGDAEDKKKRDKQKKEGKKQGAEDGGGFDNACEICQRLREHNAFVPRVVSGTVSADEVIHMHHGKPLFNQFVDAHFNRSSTLATVKTIIGGITWQSLPLHLCRVVFFAVYVSTLVHVLLGSIIFPLPVLSVAASAALIAWVFSRPVFHKQMTVLIILFLLRVMITIVFTVAMQSSTDYFAITVSGFEATQHAVEHKRTVIRLDGGSYWGVISYEYNTRSIGCWAGTILHKAHEAVDYSLRELSGISNIFTPAMS